MTAVTLTIWHHFCDKSMLDGAEDHQAYSNLCRSLSLTLCMCMFADRTQRGSSYSTTSTCSVTVSTETRWQCCIGACERLHKQPSNKSNKISNRWAPSQMNSQKVLSNVFFSLTSAHSWTTVGGVGVKEKLHTVSNTVTKVGKLLGKRVSSAIRTSATM